MHKTVVTTTEQVFVLSHLSRLTLAPGQKVAFVPVPMASRASGGIGTPFVPVGGSTWDKRPLFCPGWCYQPGQKAPPRDSSKESYSILSHMYYLGELARKPYARQEVLGSNPAGCKKIF